MSKRDLGSKLKVRLGEWEAYGDQPVSLSEPETGALQEAGVSQGGAQGESAASEQRSGRLNTVTVVPEAEVEALRAALEQERDQSRRLMEAVAREQVLHAVTLHSHVQRNGTPVKTPDPDSRKFEPLPTIYRPYPVRSRKIYLWLSIVALFIALGCTYLAYVPGK